MLASAYRVLTADQLVNEGPTLLTGFNLHVSADGAGVHIYDGMDVLSGQLVMHIVGWASDVNFGAFQFPILLNNGLFVDVGANLHHVTVFYIPLRGNSPLRAYPGFTMIDDQGLE
jgi:hypothetical protein